MTFFESEISRIAQLLRELLSRRPTREDLQRRGIYKGKQTGLKSNLVLTHCSANLAAAVEKHLTLINSKLVLIHVNLGELSRYKKRTIRI